MKNIYRKLRLAKQYTTSIIKSREYVNAFEKVETYCMFLGYPRSGHTLIGSLLDAHPDIIVANELHALRYVRYGFSKWQLFYLLFDNSRTFTRKGRSHTGYSYAVPNQWQGRFRTLRIIGDKRGGGSIKRLIARPNLLQQFRKKVGTRMRFIHVVRNPYDNISTIFRKDRWRNLWQSINFYFSLAEGLRNLKTQIAADELIDTRHESFIQNPAHSLKRLCDFLGIDTTEGYLNDCANIIFQSPHKTRCNVPWTPELIKEVGARMKEFSFLDGYSFED